MWLTSKHPTAPRTVRCSSTMPAYWTGMSQPPKPIIRAPRRTCAACSGVRFRAASGWVMRDSLASGEPLGGGATAPPGARNERYYGPPGAAFQPRRGVSRIHILARWLLGAPSNRQEVPLAWHSLQHLPSPTFKLEPGPGHQVLH